MPTIPAQPIIFKSNLIFRTLTQIATAQPFFEVPMSPINYIGSRQFVSKDGLSFVPITEVLPTTDLIGALMVDINAEFNIGKIENENKWILIDNNLKCFITSDFQTWTYFPAPGYYRLKTTANVAYMTDGANNLAYKLNTTTLTWVNIGYVAPSTPLYTNLWFVDDKGHVCNHNGNIVVMSIQLKYNSYPNPNSQKLSFSVYNGTSWTYHAPFLSAVPPANPRYLHQFGMVSNGTSVFIFEKNQLGPGMFVNITSDFDSITTHNLINASRNNEMFDNWDTNPPVFGNGIMVAANAQTVNTNAMFSEGKFIIYSTDGIVWTECNFQYQDNLINLNPNYVYISFWGGKFYVSFDEGICYSSSDGMNFTLVEHFVPKYVF